MLTMLSNKITRWYVAHGAIGVHKERLLANTVRYETHFVTLSSEFKITAIRQPWPTTHI